MSASTKTTEKKIILFSAANPTDTSRLKVERESEKIQLKLFQASQGDFFSFKQTQRTTPAGLQDAVLKMRPHIVHFSGHGSGEEGLVLEDDEGHSMQVSAEALSGLFELFSDCVECVLLNACFSQTQAQAIVQHIPFAIGMNQAIGDRAAIEFATGFYSALGEGKDIPFAFRFGCSFLKMQGIPEDLTPVFLSKSVIQAEKAAGHISASESAQLDRRRAQVVPASGTDLLLFQPQSQDIASEPTNAVVAVSPEEIRLASQDGAVSLESPFYVRSPLEERAYEAIQRPGALIRIKAPQGMGKSSLTIRVLHQAKAQGHRTVTLDFNQTNTRYFQDLDQFSQWFCASVGKPLGIRMKTTDYWDDIFGPNDNCTDYFEQYLLTDAPLTLALENFDRLFDYPEIETDFCGLLRGWHEKAKREERWEQLRLMIVYSQESYQPKDINQSPFNVGLPIELGPWNAAEVTALAQRYGLTLGTQDLEMLMKLTGGHPHLIRLTLPPLALGEVTLQDVMKTASTEAGLYRSHLMERLNYLEAHPDLKAPMRQLVTAAAPIRLSSQEAHRLDSMGLIKRVGNEVEPLGDVYRTYFKARLTA